MRGGLYTLQVREGDAALGGGGVDESKPLKCEKSTHRMIAIEMGMHSGPLSTCRWR